MSILLADRDEQDALTTTWTGLVNKSTEKNTANELETTLSESTADLPLGKALHLLVHIHSRTFDKAVTIIKSSSPSELALKTIEMPTIRALVSIEHYLIASTNLHTSFKHVYDALQEMFIKRSKDKANSGQAMRIMGYFLLHYKHCTEIQQYVCQELSSTDKRSQLAAVMLLQFLYTTYISLMDHYSNVCLVFIPSLLEIVKKNSTKPTLLVGLSCDLALQFTRYIVFHVNDAPETSGTNIIEINETAQTGDRELGVKALSFGESLLDMMKKWRTSAYDLELVCFNSLQQLTLYAADNIEAFIPSWDLTTTHLTLKAILSEKPLSTKKQKHILQFQSDQPCSSLLSFVKTLILVILQKNEWVDLYGHDRKSVIYTIEQKEVKELFTREYDAMMQNYATYHAIAKEFVLKSITTLPYLCVPNGTASEEFTQDMLDTLQYDKTNTPWMISLCLKYPESSICNLLTHVLYNDGLSISSIELLKELISTQNISFINLLEKNLLPMVTKSNQACELLILCMSFTHLPSLIQKAMQMSTIQDDKARMTCIALISKALLVESWADCSILIYLEMVRDVKINKGFVIHAHCDLNTMKLLTPASISNDYTQKADIVYTEQELSKLCSHLLGAFQLWSSKVKTKTLENGLKQLVIKTCSLPGETVCIEAWKNLSFAFLKNHSLIWDVIRQCLNIMTEQPAISATSDESIIIIRLNPMLILQTIPDNAFDLVSLPKSCIELLDNKMREFNLDSRTFKKSPSSFKHTQLCIELIQELLSRCHDNGYAEFSVALVKKIFCNQ